MGQKTILVAAQEITGGTRDEPHTAKPGTEIDAAEQKALGLSKDDVARLVARGAVVEQDAYVPRGGMAPGQTAPGTTGTPFEGLSIDDMCKTLDDAGVKYPKGTSAQDLMKIALEHQAEPAKA